VVSLKNLNFNLFLEVSHINWNNNNSNPSKQASTEEKYGMDFSPLSGKFMSGEKNPYEPRVTNREIYLATFLLSGGVP
jgi:hypothetical protein